MPIDYAKRPTPAAHKKAVWVWAGSILATAIIITTLLIIHHEPLHQQPKKNTTPTNTLQKHPIKTKTKTNTVQKKQAQYDFYQMLAQMHVQASTPTSTSNVHLSPGQPYFLLQVATSSNKKAAQGLVTKLGVMGLNASIKTIQRQTGNPRYEILAGPYAKEHNAKIDQAYLRTNHLNSIELKINSPHS